MILVATILIILSIFLWFDAITKGELPSYFWGGVFAAGGIGIILGRLL